jgi:hypothetical protein
MSGMGRREFVALLVGAAGWPVTAWAQQPADEADHWQARPVTGGLRAFGRCVS